MRYRLSSPPLCVYTCHCNACQTLTASAFSTNGPIRPEALEITKGELRHWVRTAEESGNQIPQFVCPNCGVRIYTQPAGAPTLTLRLGTLDDTSWLWPAAAIYMASAQRWIRMPEGTLLHDGAAPDFRAIVAHWQAMVEA